jgi:hypothetical protein
MMPDIMPGQSSEDRKQSSARIDRGSHDLSLLPFSDFASRPGPTERDELAWTTAKDAAISFKNLDDS